jgi:hypothetical protein
MDELATPGEPLRVRDVDHVATVRLAAGVERRVVVLLHDHHLAAGGRCSRPAEADRDLADQLAVSQDRHLLGGVVDFQGHLAADLRGGGAVDVADVSLPDR